MTFHHVLIRHFAKMARVLFYAALIGAMSFTAQGKTLAETLKTIQIGDRVEVQGTIVLRGTWSVIIHDGTAGLDIYRPNIPDYGKTGDVIRAQVEIVQGHSHLVGRVLSIEKIGEDSVLAKPIPFTPETFHAAKDLHQRPLELAGIVTDAYRDEVDPEWICLILGPQSTPVTAMVYDPRNAITNFAAMIGSHARVTGRFSRQSNSRPYHGPFLVTFFTSDIHLDQTAPADPFSARELTYNSKQRSYAITLDGYRYRTSGRVLAIWNKRSFLLKPETGTPIRIQTRYDIDPPSVDTYVEVAGFPLSSTFFARLGNAVWRHMPNTKTAAESLPLNIEPRNLLSDAANRTMFRYDMDGKLIRFQGRLAAIKSTTSLLIACDNETVDVHLPGACHVPEINSELDVTGICLFSANNDGWHIGPQRLTGFTILPRSAHDIRVLHPPPWWTPARALFVALGLIAIILASLVWNIVLQKLIARKGRELANESLARLKAELRVDERMALAVELHDTIAQNLTGVSMQLEAVAEAYRIGADSLGTLISKSERALAACCTELRNCLWELRNDAFDSDDISETIRKAITPHLGNAAANVDFRLPRARLSDSTFHALLCIIRELVINAVRHGRATQITIRGNLSERTLELSVTDNGCGFDPANRPGPADGHFGILGIQERLDRLGGTLEIISSPGKGSTFSLTITS